MRNSRNRENLQEALTAVQMLVGYSSVIALEIVKGGARSWSNPYPTHKLSILGKLFNHYKLWFVYQ